MKQLLLRLNIMAIMINYKERANNNDWRFNK